MATTIAERNAKSDNQVFRGSDLSWLARQGYFADDGLHGTKPVGKDSGRIRVKRVQVSRPK